MKGVGIKGMKGVGIKGMKGGIKGMKGAGGRDESRNGLTLLPTITFFPLIFVSYLNKLRAKVDC
jgi:hypothetical protein